MVETGGAERVEDKQLWQVYRCRGDGSRQILRAEHGISRLVCYGPLATRISRFVPWSRPF